MSLRTVSLLLRLHPDAAAAGELTGTVEVVDTGDCVPVRNADELRALVCALARTSGQPG